jgi:hypothetical protein
MERFFDKPHCRINEEIGNEKLLRLDYALSKHSGYCQMAASNKKVHPRRNLIESLQQNEAINCHLSCDNSTFASTVSLNIEKKSDGTYHISGDFPDPNLDESCEAIDPLGFEYHCDI